MKKFLPIFIAALMALPAIGQNLARENQQAVQYHPRPGVKAPATNSWYSVATRPQQPFHLSRQHPSQEKNLRVLMQQMDSSVYLEYDAVAGSWIENSMNKFSYDASGHNTSAIFYFWNPDTELYENAGKQEFTYDNGNLTEEVYFIWDAGENTYVQISQYTFSYDGDGNMTISYNYMWNGSGWDLAGKDERTYDDAGNMVQQILANWDPSGSEWYYNRKTENTYNGSGALLVSTAFNWDFLSAGWVYYSRDEHAYNGSGQQISIISSYWNAGSNLWVNDYKEDYTWDGNMNLVMVLETQWDGAQWLNSYKSELTYNNDYTSDEIILPWIFMEEADMLTHMITGVTDYEYTGQTFVMTGRSLFGYSQVNLTAVAEHETNEARIYPQPATDRVTFDWDSNEPALELLIYDSNGKQVLSQLLNNHGSVSVDQLEPGLYFYKLTGNNLAVHSGKISVR